VHLHASDREGLGRLCGYGARPALSQERLSALPDGRLAIKLKRALADGRLVLVLEPVELLRRLATLVPPPRAHLTRFSGVFGPASKWRAEVVPPPPPGVSPQSPSNGRDEGGLATPEKRRRPDSKTPCAELLLRVFREDVLACPCGGRRKVIAFLTEAKVVRQILEHLGLPTTSPTFAPARSPPHQWELGWQDDVPALLQSLR
jgi:hypothetical protein